MIITIIKVILTLFIGLFLSYVGMYFVGKDIERQNKKREEYKKILEKKRKADFEKMYTITYEENEKK